MSMYCKGCGLLHEEDDDRLCPKCEKAKSNCPKCNAAFIDRADINFDYFLECGSRVPELSAGPPYQSGQCRIAELESQLQAERAAHEVTRQQLCDVELEAVRLQAELAELRAKLAGK